MRHRCFSRSWADWIISSLSRQHFSFHSGWPVTTHLTEQIRNWNSLVNISNETAVASSRLRIRLFKLLFTKTHIHTFSLFVVVWVVQSCENDMNITCVWSYVRNTLTYIKYINQVCVYYLTLGWGSTGGGVSSSPQRRRMWRGLTLLTEARSAAAAEWSFYQTHKHTLCSTDT